MGTFTKKVNDVYNENMMFRDRMDAGRQLAGRLAVYANKKNVVVCGLPRGGVVVAAEVASALQLPLDIIAVRKIGHPGNPEFAIGAVAADGTVVFDGDIIQRNNITKEYLDEAVRAEQHEAQRRNKLYRGSRPQLQPEGKTIILVDDGIATGATMRVAVMTMRKQNAAKIVVAVPVAAADMLKILEQEAHEVIMCAAPAFFGAVGAFYERFDQVRDEEVLHLLQ